MDIITLIKEKFPSKFRLRFEEMNNGEGCVQHPVYDGRPTHCRSAMWTLVSILKPRSILEIGSWRYDSSNMMALSLDENHGCEWKCDIHTYDIILGGYNEDEQRPNNTRVKPMFWLPHHTSYDSWKYNNPRIIHPEFVSMTNEQIFEVNKSKLLYAAPENGYDLILIDGDHSYEGVSFDWQYAGLVSNKRTVLVIDDLYDSRHHQVRKFWDELKTNKYDFDDWNASNPEKLVSMGVTTYNAEKL